MIVLAQKALFEHHNQNYKTTLHSNPPVHGARIVATVLNTPELYDQWRENIKTMSTRILAMRDLLRSELEQLDSERSWQHITTQIGMFSFTGLNKNQCEWMKAEKSIYTKVLNKKSWLFENFAKILLKFHEYFT